MNSLISKCCHLWLFLGIQLPYRKHGLTLRCAHFKTFGSLCQIAFQRGHTYLHSHQWRLIVPVSGFPGGAVVGSLPANAGDAGSSPGLGGSHMPRSGWAREPQLLSLRIWSLCSATGEAAIVRGPRTAMKSGPCLPQLEKALAQKRRPNTAKNK